MTWEGGKHGWWRSWRVRSHPGACLLLYGNGNARVLDTPLMRDARAKCQGLYDPSLVGDAGRHRVPMEMSIGCAVVTVLCYLRGRMPYTLGVVLFAHTIAVWRGVFWLLCLARGWHRGFGIEQLFGLALHGACADWADEAVTWGWDPSRRQ